MVWKNFIVSSNDKAGSFFFFVSSKKYKTLDFSDVYRDNNIYIESNDYLSDVLVMMT